VVRSGRAGPTPASAATEQPYCLRLERPERAIERVAGPAARQQRAQPAPVESGFDRAAQGFYLLNHAGDSLAAVIDAGGLAAPDQIAAAQRHDQGPERSRRHSR